MTDHSLRRGARSALPSSRCANAGQTAPLQGRLRMAIRHALALGLLASAGALAQEAPPADAAAR